MKRLSYLFCFIYLLAFHPFFAEAGSYGVVTASNASDANTLLLYDASGKQLQSIPTGGKGGVPPNKVGGGIAKMNNLLAVINYGSQSVTIFQWQGNGYKVLKVIPVQSKPVSVAFGNEHLYVLGTDTIESHKMEGDSVADAFDGKARLLVGDGSGAQVGVLNKQLIISERSNTIELVDLRYGLVTEKINPVQLPPPPGNDTPVGLATRGNTAYVTIAHSDKVGLVRDGKLMVVVSSESQHAPCWLALMGPWLYCCNTPSQSISKYKVTEDTLALADLIAAKTQLGPSDIDAEEGLVAVLETDGKSGAARITQFAADSNGNLKLNNSTPTANTANGVAVIKLP